MKRWICWWGGHRQTRYEAHTSYSHCWCGEVRISRLDWVLKDYGSLDWAWKLRRSIGRLRSHRDRSNARACTREHAPERVEPTPPSSPTIIKRTLSDGTEVYWTDWQDEVFIWTSGMLGFELSPRSVELMTGHSVRLADPTRGVKYLGGD